MKGHQMKLLQKLLLSAVVTLSLTGPCNSMDERATACAQPETHYSELPQNCPQTGAATPAESSDCVLDPELVNSPISVVKEILYNHLISAHDAKNFAKRYFNICLRFRNFLTTEDATRAFISLNLQSPLHEACKNNLLPIVKLLIFSPDLFPYGLYCSGFNRVNCLNIYGFTPFHLAIQNGCLEVVQFLITVGADVNTTDGYGCFTPLQWAELKGYTEIAQALRAAGAHE